MEVAAPPTDPVVDKAKKRYRKKKTKLEEAFPSYLQVALAHILTHCQSASHVTDWLIHPSPPGSLLWAGPPGQEPAARQEVALRDEQCCRSC